MERQFFAEYRPVRTSESYGEKLAHVRQLVSQLEKIGVRATSSRVGSYVRFLERYLAKKCTVDEIEQRLLHVLREVDEWSWIQRAFQNTTIESIASLLKEAIGGPDFVDAEGENTRPRNIQLELRVGSYFLQSGFEVKFSDSSDLTLDVVGFPVFVECKRLGSTRQVIKRASEAAKQLRRSYRGVGEPAYGLIVLDVSRIVEPRHWIGIGANELATRDAIRSRIVAFADAYDTSKVFGKDKKLLAVWHQAILPTYHLQENESSTIFSSNIRIYAQEGQRRWMLFQKIRDAFESASSHPDHLILPPGAAITMATEPKSD
ncbi:MAG: hypothetical protein WAO95_17655 [Burkholderiales bacterium]